MSVLRRLPPPRVWIEPLLAALVASGLVHAMWHLWSYGFLPQPFFYQPADLWGDWFNVAYWAYDKGTYDAYGTVYPPLTFVFLRAVSLPRCYPISGGAIDTGAGLAARYCDWLGIVVSHLIYIVQIVVVARIFMKQDRRTAPWRAYALAAGFPMLEALERNNLVILAFLLVVLGFGPLVRQARLRWLSLACAINLKIYLIAAVVPQLVRRRWLWVEGVLLATVAVYLVSYAILGRGTPAEVYDNIQNFSSGGASSFLDVWFPATYLALKALLENWTSPAMILIGSRNVQLALTAISVTTHGTQAIIIAAVVAAWLRPETISRHRLTALGLSFALITSESGGYTPVMIFFFVFLERWQGFGPKWAIVACYLLCLPYDIRISPAPPLVRDLFWPNRTVITTYYVTLGPMIRPLILMSIPLALSCTTLREVWADIRTQGWRGRTRYRADLPLLTAGGAPARRLTPPPPILTPLATRGPRLGPEQPRPRSVRARNPSQRGWYDRLTSGWSHPARRRH